MRRNRGFTLLELLVVVGIVAILAALALPSYTEYVRKGKRGEAAAALGDVSLRQERYRADNPTYGTMDQLTGSSTNTTAYNAQYKYYTVSITASPTATTYEAVATRKGDLANDPKCGNLKINMINGVATKGMNGGVESIDYCWRQ